MLFQTDIELIFSQDESGWACLAKPNPEQAIFKFITLLQLRGGHADKIRFGGRCVCKKLFASHTYAFGVISATWRRDKRESLEKGETKCKLQVKLCILARRRGLVAVSDIRLILQSSSSVSSNKGGRFSFHRGVGNWSNPEVSPPLS